MRNPFLGKLVVNLPFEERILFFEIPVVRLLFRLAAIFLENL
jgi:hypothetical protein